MSTIRGDLGRKVKVLREQVGFTQEELATKVHVESASHISKVERGTVSASYELLARIAEALGVEVKDLFDFQTRGAKRLKATMFEKWSLRITSLLKGKGEKDLKKAYAVLTKVFSK